MAIQLILLAEILRVLTPDWWQQGTRERGDQAEIRWKSRMKCWRKTWLYAESDKRWTEKHAEVVKWVDGWGIHIEQRTCNLFIFIESYYVLIIEMSRSVNHTFCLRQK